MRIFIFGWKLLKKGKIVCAHQSIKLSLRGSNKKMLPSAKLTSRSIAEQQQIATKVKEALISET